MTEQVPSRRRDETRARLVRAAVEVFAEQGIIASTVEQVCERAGFSRGAFYSNFDSKEAVCREILELEAEFYADAFRQAGADFAAHFAANPADLLLPPYEAMDRGLRPLLSAFVVQGEQGDERAAVVTNMSLLFTELGLYAAREPAMRADYAVYADGIFAPFLQLFGPLLALTGLELRADPLEAAEIIHALWEAGSRRALMSATPDQVIDAVRQDVMIAMRLCTRPVPGRDVAVSGA